MKYQVYDNQFDNPGDVQIIEAPNAIVALAKYLDGGADYVIDNIGDSADEAGASYKDSDGDPIMVNADGVNNDWRFRCEPYEC